MPCYAFEDIYFLLALRILRDLRHTRDYRGGAGQSKMVDCQVCSYVCLTIALA